MNRFKIVVFAVIACVGIFFAMQRIYGNKLDDLRTSLRLERESNASFVNITNEKIGDYTYKLGVMEDSLKNANSLSKKQRHTIKELQKELEAKATEISNITVEIDSIQSEGSSEIIKISNGSIVYTINEHKQGYHLTATIVHPSGDYAYTIRQDPLTMELYMLKEKGTGYRIGSIKFPSNPNVRVTKWELFYDTDTRAWYDKLWENAHFDVGFFGGITSGISTMVGYNRLMLGPVFTEKGMSFGASYRIK